MYNVQSLVKLFNLSAKQVRDRLTLLKPLLNGYIKVGDQNAKLLTEDGVNLFAQLIQLETKGVTGKKAVELLEQGYGSGDSTLKHLQDYDQDFAELLQVLKDRIEEQAKVIDTLETQLTSKDEEITQLHNLLINGSPSNSKPRNNAK